MKIKTIYIINMYVGEQPNILFACESEKQAIDKLKHLASFWSSDTTVITWDTETSFKVTLKVDPKCVLESLNVIDTQLFLEDA